MGNNLFSLVEKEFRDFSYHLHKLETLVAKRDSLSIVRSSSDFSERVDTGGRASCPTEFWYEEHEFLDEQIARHRLHVIPIQKLLDYLEESRPEYVELFHLRYRERRSWPAVEEALSISRPTRDRMRKEIVLTGARFCGFLSDF